MAKTKLDYSQFSESNLPARFWNKINKTESCWLWTGKIDDGYGRYPFSKNGKSNLYLVHRIMISIYKNGIEPDMFVDHLCRVRNCCNPAHLEKVTIKENTKRGKGKHSQPDSSKCINGHSIEGPDANVHISERKTRRGIEALHITCKICNWSKRVKN
jgi:hypothetical protein